MTTTTNARSSWDILEDLYGQLLDSHDEPVNPDEVSDWDLETAVTETANKCVYEKIWGLSVFKALAENGYLDDDQIWDEINQAMQRGLTALIDERWEEREEEDGEDGEDW